MAWPAPWIIRNSRLCANAIARFRASWRHRLKRQWVLILPTDFRMQKNLNARYWFPNRRPRDCLASTSFSRRHRMNKDASKAPSRENRILLAGFQQKAQMFPRLRRNGPSSNLGVENEKAVAPYPLRFGLCFFSLSQPLALPDIDQTCLRPKYEAR